MSEVSPASDSPDDDMPPVPIRKLIITIATAVVPLGVYFVVPLDGELGAVVATVLVLGAAAAMIPLSFQQARLVLRSDHPLFDAVRCLVTGFVLLVVAFSSAYYVLGNLDEPEIQNLATKLDAVYFSVTILATVGFGDISATGQLARGIVTLQMVVNFALLGVALRVVSWALKERQGNSLQRRLEREPRRLRVPPPR